jgi:hypothetical protein
MALEPGARLRLIGQAGAYFVLTVGEVFSADQITERIESGEWKRAETEAKPRRKRT